MDDIQLTIAVYGNGTQPYLPGFLNSLDLSLKQSWTCEVLITEVLPELVLQELRIRYPQLTIVPCHTQYEKASMSDQCQSIQSLARGRYVLFVRVDTVFSHGTLDGLVNFFCTEAPDLLIFPQKNVDGEVYGYENLGFSRKNGSLVHRDQYYWDENLLWPLEFSESLFCLSLESLKRADLNSDYGLPFVFYDWILTNSWVPQLYTEPLGHSFGVDLHNTLLGLRDETTRFLLGSGANLLTRTVLRGVDRLFLNVNQWEVQVKKMEDDLLATKTWALDLDRDLEKARNIVLTRGDEINSLSTWGSTLSIELQAAREQILSNQADLKIARQKLNEQTEEIEKLSSWRQSLDKELASCHENYQKVETELARANQLVASRGIEIETLSRWGTGLDNEIGTIRNESRKLEMDLAQANQLVLTRGEEIEVLSRWGQDLDTDLLAQRDHTKKLEAELIVVKQQVTKRLEEIESLSDQNRMLLQCLVSSQDHVSNLETDITERDHNLGLKDLELESQKGVIEELRELVETLEARTEDLGAQITRQDAEIKWIKSSFLWRVYRHFLPARV